MNQLSVLIVGAGPTGLMMACELTRFGVPVRIIDKKATPTQTTNAAGIHTRTLEIFEHLGIVSGFIEEGFKTEYLQIISDKQKLAKIPLNNIDSHFNYLIMLPQSETEKILNDYLLSLGVKVERNVELVNLEQVNNTVISTLKLPDGTSETVVSDWVIGCDGYRSKVREKAKIKMSGADVDQEFFVADVRIQTSYERDTVTMFLNKGTLLGLFSLPNAENDKYRVVANSNQIQNKDRFSEEDIRAMIHHYTQGECEVKEILWSSPFWIHSMLAEKLQNGSVLIAGDAAHVHSPAGAQGMNTGLQDAFNLAWKLALVIQGHANREILNSYQTERYPIIKSVVFATEKLAILGLTKNSWLFALRNFLFRNVAGKVKFLQNKVVGRVTQIALKYKNSTLIDKNHKGHSQGPQAGERTPDVKLNNNTRLYDYIRNNQHNVLLFTGASPSLDTIAAVKTASQQLEAKWGNIIKVHVVSEQKNDLPNSIEDTGLVIHQRYAVANPSMCLLRPDQYIGLFVGEINGGIIDAFLQKAGFIA